MRDLRGWLTTATIVSEQAMTFSSRAHLAHPVQVSRTAGLLVVAGREPIAVGAFTVASDRIVELDIIADPTQLKHLDLSEFAFGRPMC